MKPSIKKQMLIFSRVIFISTLFVTVACNQKKQDEEEFIKYKKQWDEFDKRVAERKELDQVGTGYYHYDIYDNPYSNLTRPDVTKFLRDGGSDVQYQRPPRFLESKSERIDRWKKLAVNDPKYKHLLGQAYFYGDGVLKNPNKAIELYLSACEEKVTDSHYRVGEILCEKKDFRKAKSYVEYAFENGDGGTKILAKRLWEKYNLVNY